MNTFFAVLFIILNILDITTTRRIIALGGREVWPLPWLLMKFNLFLPIKIIVTLALAGVIIIVQDPTTGSTLCGIISLFVINNYYQLYMYKKEIGLTD
jgi:hypothetical protein